MAITLLLILLIVENIGFFYYAKINRQDRNELIKRCSPGYMAGQSGSKDKEKRPEHKNMVQEQQRKMTRLHSKGGDV